MSNESKTIGGILLLIALVIAVIFTGILSISESTAPVSENAVCEHKFVVTSEYDWWLQSYKTFSYFKMNYL